jgi:TRAP-type C4-dicarboxylate transport system permease large subunit
MILDATAMIVLTVPLFLPFFIGNEINLIWFGILLMMMVQIGLITPPIGMNVFVVKATIREVPTATIFRGMVPFMIANIIVLMLLVAFPDISLFLPNVMR